MEDILWCPALGGEVLDVSINWGDWSDGGSGGCGRRQGFSGPNLLGVIVSFGSSLGLSGSAFICTVSLFATSETESFSDAASMVHWGELFQVDEIHFHGIRVSGGAQGRGEGGEG